MYFICMPERTNKDEFYENKGEYQWLARKGVFLHDTMKFFIINAVRKNDRL